MFFLCLILYIISKKSGSNNDLGFVINSSNLIDSSVFGYIADFEETNKFVEYYELQNATISGQDYWGGAVKYCKDLKDDNKVWRMPSEQEVAQIAKQIYGNDGCLNVKCKKENVVKSELWKLFQRQNNNKYGFSLWLYSPVTKEKAKAWEFADNNTYTYYENRNNKKISTICVSDKK